MSEAATITMPSTLQLMPARLQTGIADIDDEHHILLDLHGRLASCCTEFKESCSGCSAHLQGQCALELFSIYEELFSFMSLHFMHEETLMGNCPADWVARHKYEHAEIATSLSALLAPSTRKHDLITARQLYKHISVWLEDHIARWDIPLAHFLKGDPSIAGLL